jgi:NhaP-type Na+/H+ or K+/H+ antiporter
VIPALSGWGEAFFAGYFGPIGVGAVFYTQVSIEKIPHSGSRERLLQ